MAQELQLRDTSYRVKIRSPWAAALLPLITLGIYHLVWWYRIHSELRDYGQAKGYDLGQNPTSSTLALFPGGIIIVPALITYWRGTKRVQGAARIGGKQPINGWLALVMYLLISPALWAYMQASLNDLWRSEGTPLAGEALPPAPGDQLPPRLDQPATPVGSEPPAAPPPPAPPPPGVPGS